MQTMSTSQRIITVDALRGFALLGILLAHMIYWYTAGPLPGSLFGKYNDVASGIISVLNEVLVSGKFFAFFSFLFGLSFYLQMQSMEKRNDNFVLRYGWRIAILGMIGLVHHAFWQGDILSIYAPLGFILLPLRKLGNKWILVLGILFAVNLPGLIIEVIRFLTEVNTPPPANAPQFDPEAAGKEYYRIITEAGFPELWRYNLARLSTKFQFQLDSGRIFITFGFFLLGMYTGHKQWFETPETARSIWKKICRCSAWLALGTLLVAVAMFVSNEVFKLGWQQSRTIGIIFSVIQNVNSAALVCLYVAGLTLLMYRVRWQKLLFPLASVGKLALTCYLGQTFFGLLLFYHVGFGAIGQTAPWLNWLIGIAYFLIQVILSRLWLKYFYYGPLEWAWRSLTFFQRYRFRRR
jgi:uncharacterized protein